MPPSDPRDNTHSIALLAVIVVALAVVIISILTITAILAGPPM